MLWDLGVDRRFGQAMSPGQLARIGRYYARTPFGEHPQWVFGLYHMISGQGWGAAAFLEWDYGLSMDVELLLRNRSGGVPFEFMHGLWVTMGQRRERMQGTVAL